MLVKQLNLSTFFDMMNVRSFSKGTRARKPFLQPYRFGNDFRIEVSIYKIYATCF